MSILNDILDNLIEIYSNTERLKAFNDLNKDILFKLDTTNQDVVKLISLNNATEQDIKDLNTRLNKIEKQLLSVLNGGK